MIIVEEEEKRFYIKESTIPNAGNGCFAKELLKKGDWLEIIGVLVKRGGVADFCTEYARRYKFADDEKSEYKVVPFGFGGMLNHSDDPKQQNCRLEFVKRLVRRSQHSDQVVYRFTRDIQPDEELFGNYGEDVGREVQIIAKNFNFLEENRADIEEFAKFDLYQMRDLYSTLCNAK